MAATGPVDVFSVPPGHVPPDLFEEMAAFCRDVPAQGGVGGYIGYEAARALAPELALPASPDGLPVVHLTKFAQMTPITAPMRGPSQVTAMSVSEGLPQADFEAKVQAVIDAILEGEIFQANISRRLSATFDDHASLAEDLFARLIGEDPAAYAAFLPLPDGAVLSNSPELFLEIQDDQIAAEPIKGTLPRLSDPNADQAQAAQLLASEKDRAENIMIADLLRNDLAKVCQDHTIREPAICALKTLPKVHHLYSRIEGRLRDGVGPLEALAAAFPCGSVTGAPKHRVMQIITNQEGEGRGPYCGTIAFLPAQGPTVFSVAIRTASLSYRNGQADLHYRTGGGITALSDPEAEYRETEAKAYGFEALTQ